MTTRKEDSIPTHSPHETHPCAATLLARVEAHPLTASGDPLAFESRLADDNGWTLGHAVRVVREYRRFLVLTQVAGVPVCPSDDIDRAWQLHSSRNADDERFCRDVFGVAVPRPIEPADAPRREAGLHHYRRVFGAHAPAPVWPDGPAGAEPAPEARFAWQLPVTPAAGPLVALALLLGAVLVAVLCHWIGALRWLHRIDDTPFVLMAFAGLVIILLVTLGDAHPAANGGRRDTLDAYEAALLECGAARVATTAMAMLVRLQFLELRPPPRRGWWLRGVRELVVARGIDDKGADRLHPVERACLSAVPSGVLGFDQALAGVRSECAAMARRLVAAGLMADRTLLSPDRVAALGMAAVFLVVTFERFLHALHGPVSGNAALVLSLIDAWFVFGLLRLEPAVNPRGRRALLGLWGALRTRRKAASGPASAVIDTGLLPMTLALYGPVAVLDDPGFEGLAAAIGADGMRQANPGHDD